MEASPSPSGTESAAAAQTLFAELYSELHRIARRELTRQCSPASVSPTTILHEAYIDMASRHSASFADEAHFMAYAARVMRGVIIDHSRRRQAQKRGGAFVFTTLAEAHHEVIDDKELPLISDALDELARAEPDLAQVVDLRFFCGFSFAEIAAMQRISERTVQRKWDKARTYLYHRIRPNLSL